MLEINWSSPFFLILAPTGLIFWIAGEWMLRRPPRKINQMVGYRTQRSMANQEAWDFAQTASAHVSRRVGVYEMLAGALWIFIPGVHELVEVILATGIVIYSCIHLILATEKMLKERFPEH